jgi:LmbE family N-acetylglucosaminyl deacetylase
MPNWVIDISEYIENKINALKCYGSQIPPFPGSRSLEAITALSKFRGTQAGFAYGEAFHIIRMCS